MEVSESINSLNCQLNIMPEQQNIEYKSVWKDEYLKWICGFANANGGTLAIGKNDDGEVVGVPNTKRLLEDIPNKIKDVLGIIADVNLHEQKVGVSQTAQGSYIEIVVEPQPTPVSYKGEYHYRSGSTKQELKGAALDKFLLQKYGKKWDSVAIPNVSVAELSTEAFTFFKEKGIKSNRIDENSRNDTPAQMLENLKLTEKCYLKRAALLLFHPDPEKFFTGAYIKIGFFRTDSDLLFQDEVHGNLLEQVEKTMKLLLTKYTKALISYEGISRVETYEYPKDALREALLNAITHKDYAGCTPIQISVYADKIMLWNEGELPENWTVKNLLTKHSSRPYNPDIANAFFRSGYVEAWGRGIDKITEQCAAAGLPAPQFSPNGSDFWVIFRKNIYSKDNLSKLGLNERQTKAMLYILENGKITNKTYQELNQISNRTAASDLKELVEKFNMLKTSGAGAGTFYHT
ncbi:MAG: putative DNA binding domain-containing protein [Prevotellaceae bacterium]|jgi:ATP-dependent DNA helicase RecG|nr:putative DNA binding domain-containing protein [Prevotellaceae bacterium]